MTDLFQHVAGHSAPVAAAPSSPAATDFSHAPIGSPIEPDELLAELDREVAMRVAVFGKAVADGKMRPDVRDRRIAIMKRARAQCASIADNAVFFRRCLKHRKAVEQVLDAVEACMDVLESAGVAAP